MAPRPKMKSWTNPQRLQLQLRSPPLRTSRPPHCTRTAVRRIPTIRCSCSRAPPPTGSSLSSTCTASTACRSRGPPRLSHTSSRWLLQEEQDRCRGTGPRQAASGAPTHRPGTPETLSSSGHRTTRRRPGGPTRTRHPDPTSTRRSNLRSTRSWRPSRGPTRHRSRS